MAAHLPAELRNTRAGRHSAGLLPLRLHLVSGQRHASSGAQPAGPLPRGWHSGGREEGSSPPGAEGRTGRRAAGMKPESRCWERTRWPRVPRATLATTNERFPIFPESNHAADGEGHAGDPAGCGSRGWQSVLDFVFHPSTHPPFHPSFHPLKHVLLACYIQGSNKNKAAANQHEETTVLRGQGTGACTALGSLGSLASLPASLPQDGGNQDSGPQQLTSAWGRPRGHTGAGPGFLPPPSRRGTQWVGVALD